MGKGNKKKKNNQKNKIKQQNVYNKNRYTYNNQINNNNSSTKILTEKNAKKEKDYNTYSRMEKTYTNLSDPKEEDLSLDNLEKQYKHIFNYEENKEAKKIETSDDENNNSNFYQSRVEKKYYENYQTENNNFYSDEINRNKKLLLDNDKKSEIEDIFNFYTPKTSKTKKNRFWKFCTLFLLIIMVLDFIFLKHEFRYNTNASDNTIVDEQPPVQDETYVLLGDSLFDFYNSDEYLMDYNVINSGINGITAKEMKTKLDETVYKYNPNRVYILLGTNDIHLQYTPKETFENIKAIAEEIQKHDQNIKIYILSLLPINSTDDEKIDSSIYKYRSNEKINEVNGYLKEYCQNNDINYIDVHDKLIDDNNQLKLAYTKEGLHITDLGYYHITMELLKTFSE